MTVSDLKLKIFREIDSLEKDQLEELYGMLLKFIHTERDMDDWEKLTTEEQQGVVDAIDEIDSGRGIAHEKVMENIRKKFNNA